MAKNFNPEIMICVGCGGVGKTSVAGALALAQAVRGKRSLVITIDPAKRLLDALGIDSKKSRPEKIAIDKFTKQDVKMGGEFYAFMPNLKKEWQDFLAASIEKKSLLHDISTNHFYQYLVGGLPGALEIICGHILFKLKKSGQYDVIILDTPPSSHSVAFFDVPQKISRLLNQNIFRAMMSKRHSFLMKVTKKLAFFSGSFIDKTLEKIIGSHFLSELIDFALTIDLLYEPMLERTQALEELLKDNATKYYLVLRPSAEGISDSLDLMNTLKTRGIRVDKFIVNQVCLDLDIALIKEESTQALAKISDQEQRSTLIKMTDAFCDEKLFEAKILQRNANHFGDLPLILVPKFDANVKGASLINLLLNSLMTSEK